MTERLRLHRVKLTGNRAGLRRMLIGSLALFAVIGAVGYVLPAHRVGSDTAFHSNFADGGPLSLLVLMAAGVSVLLLRKRGLGAGAASGLIASVGAVIAVAPVLLAHLFSHIEEGIGEPVFALGVLGMFFLGATTLVAEPVLYVIERRRIERALRPAPLPVARIHDDDARA